MNLKIYYLFFIAFEPVRVSVQGELIRDLDTNNNQQKRKLEHADSDDEEQPSQINMNGRSAMNIYIQRRRKVLN
jgi:hypothetical protein